MPDFVIDCSTCVGKLVPTLCKTRSTSSSSQRRDSSSNLFALCEFVVNTLASSVSSKSCSKFSSFFRSSCGISLRRFAHDTETVTGVEYVS